MPPCAPANLPPLPAPLRSCKPPAPAGPPAWLQTYTRDVFLFIFLVLTAVAGGYSLKQHRTLLLHRTQTEEWKGWMQVGLAAGAGGLMGAGSWGGGLMGAGS